MDEKFILKGYKILNLSEKNKEPYSNACDYAKNLALKYRYSNELQIQYNCLKKGDK